MTYTKRSYFDSAINAANTAAKIINMTGRAYTAGSNLYNSFSYRKPNKIQALANQYRSTPARSAYRPNPYDRVSFRKRTYRRKRVVVRRRRRPVKRNLYSKTRKTMRRNNKGPLNLQQRLMSGGKIPYETRAKLHSRMSSQIGLTTLNGPTQYRDFNLCQIPYPSLNGPFQLMLPQWYWMWKAMYKSYLVTGAKISLKITAPFWPSNIATAGNTSIPSDDYQAQQVPHNVTPGYWYIRVNYNKGSTVVGSPIQFTGDNFYENQWTSFRDFQSDPTVTYKKDMTSIRQKLSTTSTANLNEVSTSNVSIIPNDTISYEIETSTKPVYLSTVFSYRRHLNDNNPLKNAKFRETGQSSSVWGDNNFPQFRVRYGYIGFNLDNTIQYHIPIDRNIYRQVECDISYNVIFRTPQMDPDGTDVAIPSSTPSAAKLYEIPTLDFTKSGLPDIQTLTPIDEDESEYESDPEF